MGLGQTRSDAQSAQSRWLPELPSYGRVLSHHEEVQNATSTRTTARTSRQHDQRQQIRVMEWPNTEMIAQISRWYCAFGGLLGPLGWAGPVFRVILNSPTRQPLHSRALATSRRWRARGPPHQPTSFHSLAPWSLRGAGTDLPLLCTSGRWRVTTSAGYQHRRSSPGGVPHKAFPTVGGLLRAMS